MDPIKDKIRTLYSLCFQDDPEFTDAYFNYIYTPEQSYYIERNKEIVSALQVAPVSVQLGAQSPEDASGGYISGACTDPAYRGKGLMGELLKKVFLDMYGKGTHFSVLIPANEPLFDFYAGFGFARCFDYSIETREQFTGFPEKSPEVFLKQAPPRLRWRYEPSEDLPDSMNCVVTPHPDYLYYYEYIHSRREYSGYLYYYGNFEKLVQKDLMLYGGQTWLVKNQEDQLTGHALCYVQDGQVYIPAMTTDSLEIQDFLLHQIAYYYQVPKICMVREPDSLLGTQALGMARMIHIPELLTLYAGEHPELIAEFSVSDPLIPQNNGTYSFPGNGRVVHSKQGSALQVSVPQLTQAVLGYEPEKLPGVLSLFPSSQPYMHLMANS